MRGGAPPGWGAEWSHIPSLAGHSMHIQTPSHQQGALEMPNVAIQTPMDGAETDLCPSL